MSLGNAKFVIVIILSSKSWMLSLRLGVLGSVGVARKIDICWVYFWNSLLVDGLRQFPSVQVFFPWSAIYSNIIKICKAKIKAC